MSYKTLTNSLREVPSRSKCVTRKSLKYWSFMSRTLGQESLPKTFPDYSLALASCIELQTWITKALVSASRSWSKLWSKVAVRLVCTQMALVKVVYFASAWKWTTIKRTQKTKTRLREIRDYWLRLTGSQMKHAKSCRQKAETSHSEPPHSQADSSRKISNQLILWHETSNL